MLFGRDSIAQLNPKVSSEEDKMWSNFPAYMNSFAAIQNSAFLPFRTELLKPLEAGTIGCCQVRVRMLMPWNKWFYTKPNRTVFIDMQTLDEHWFGPRHVTLVQKNPTMWARQSPGDFALLKPKQAQYLNSISGKNEKLIHLKGWLNPSEKAKFSRPCRTASCQTQTEAILFGWLTCSPISIHELQGCFCPFFLFILGFNNNFQSKNLLWIKAAAGWSTHWSKHTWKFKLTLPYLGNTPNIQGKQAYSLISTKNAGDPQATVN